MAKVKVIFDREKCIGARACAAVCPKYWGMDDEKDGKAIPPGAKLNAETKVYEMEVEVSDQDLACLKEAAAACPVTAIEVIG